MSTFHTLPSGKIMYKVKGESMYSLYAKDDRTHLASLSEADLLDMQEAVKILSFAEYVLGIDPDSAKPHTEAKNLTKTIASLSQDEFGIKIVYKDGTEKYFEEKVK